MAGIGRNKKTVKEHKLKGTYQPCRHGGQTNPDPPPGRPSLPEPLEGRALAMWDQTVGHLEVSKSLSAVDALSIYELAVLHAETEALAEQRDLTLAAVDRLEENQGDIGQDDLLAFFQELGKMRRLAASYSTQVRQGRMAIRQYLIEFGLTPASRGRVKLPEAPPTDEFAAFDGLKAV